MADRILHYTWLVLCFGVGMGIGECFVVWLFLFLSDDEKEINANFER